MKQKITLLNYTMCLATFLAFSQSLFAKNHSNMKGVFAPGNVTQAVKAPPLILHPNYSTSSNNLRLKSETITMHRLDSVLYYNWDEDENAWINSGNNQFYTYDEYDEQGNLILAGHSYSRLGDEDSLLFDIYKEEYSYTIDNKISTYVEYYWEEGDWVETRKTIYEYDLNSNLKSVTDDNWSIRLSGYDHNKIEYIYDAEGKLITEIEYMILAEITENYRKTVFAYHEDGNLASEVEYRWVEDQWSESGKFEYMYDVSGKLIKEVEFNWQEEMWVPNEKTETHYTLTDFEFVEFHWDSHSEEWNENFRAKYMYDNSVSFSQLVLPKSYSYFNSTSSFFSNKILGGFTYWWDADKKDWNDSQKIESYYTDFEVTPVHSVLENNASIYPNPANEFVSVSFANSTENAVFEIYDTQGHRVFTKEMNGPEQISLKHLHSGVYIYTFTTPNDQSIGKLIKK